MLKNLKLERLRPLILYNTIVHGESYTLRKHVARNRQTSRDEARRRAEIERRQQVPLCLRYFRKEDEVTREETTNGDAGAESEPTPTSETRFPFAVDPDWMTAYDSFDDADVEAVRPIAAHGTSDPLYPASRVSCGGCGAKLHCNDPEIPGYLPSEIFKGRNDRELRTMICQRCHFLREYEVALDVRVPPSSYLDLIARVRSERALVVLVVDLLDFPCSIWPGLVEAIGGGARRPFVVVGNKVDLLPQDSPGYLARVERCLRDSIAARGLTDEVVRDVVLVSARTGYGVEALVTRLQSAWAHKGDVYLVGCTNVGKSTLFNALVRSDYCKPRAADAVREATVSRWPGTTLDLLRFPMLRPEGWKMAERTRRLAETMRAQRQERELRRLLFKSTGDPKYAMAFGLVDKTFSAFTEKEAARDPFAYRPEEGRRDAMEKVGIDEEDDRYRHGRWCYDTPGAVHPEQIISSLTIEELATTLPKSIMRPRSYHMRPGTTLFVAGLARLDLLRSDEAATFTVLASRSLPITVCKTQHADELYEELLGTELMGVPAGDERRMSLWPGLKRGEALSVIGVGMDASASDVVLSSAGWVSISSPEKVRCEILPWTPDARGIYLRTPPLLPFAGLLRGKRIMRTPAYNIGYLFGQ